MTKKIFVSIACYEDTDVITTCCDMLSKASNRDDLRIVVALQTDDLQKFEGLEQAHWHGQLPIQVIHRPKSWATGVGKARKLIYDQLRDEPYFFQTDCHMRFQQGWDETLLSELNACPNPEMTVISSLPPEFIIETGELISMTPFAPKPVRFVEAVPVSAFSPIPQDLPTPPRIAHIAASIVFCSNAAIRASKPDPFYAYYGEEFSHSIRWWTHGYDIHACRPCIAHHAYDSRNKRENIYEQPAQIMRHWRSMQRVTGLLGLEAREKLSQVALVDLDQYNLGELRTVSSWEAEFGIDLVNRMLLSEGTWKRRIDLRDSV